MKNESNRRKMTRAYKATKRLNFIGKIVSQYAGNKIKIARQELKINQAKKISTQTFRYMGHVEAGINMSMKTFYDIAIALNINPCELIPPLHVVKLALKKYKNKEI